MKFSSSKEVNAIVADKVREGWRFSRGGKHARLTAPSGALFVTVPGSPSCFHAPSNFAADIKRLEQLERGSNGVLR